MPTLNFPAEFRWGVATSSYQIEGAAYEDGRSESIWDRFARQPGAILDGSDGTVACDHYHRWRDDVALLRELGVQSYRFSVAWPRVLPEGRGRVNEAGLDFYSRLVDALLEAGITPFVTLYHWDLPQVLQDAGGWPARATAEAFVEYADVVSRRLGDRVKHWITHNEPWCASMLSYQIGQHAPGRHDWPAALAASHHLLLSHGLAVPVIRANSPGAQVGITLNFTPSMPTTGSQADAEANRRFDGYFHRWFLDPLYGRHYPADMIADYTAAGFLPQGGPPFVQPGDLQAIAAPTDFLGINYYTRALIGAAPLGSPELWHEQPPATSEPLTDMGWRLSPQSLYELLLRLHYEYRPGALYVTENGASYPEGPSADGRVHDERRLNYLCDHFAAAHRSMAAGVPLAGYFVWSLMDNFEWAMGYSQRFGIVWVDYETQRRIPKDSALWYKRVIAANAVSL